MVWSRLFRAARVAASVAAISSRRLSPSSAPSLPQRKTTSLLLPGLKVGFSSQAWVDPPTGEVVEVPLAQMGEGIAECELLKWFVQEGDHVEEFQPVCAVQSDKATIKITSCYKGKVLFVPGDIVKVGESLLKILAEETEISECPIVELHISMNYVNLFAIT